MNTRMNEYEKMIEELENKNRQKSHDKRRNS